MRLLLVNWQDRENPQAGGAEIHLHEIFGRLAARGHEVTLLHRGLSGPTLFPQARHLVAARCPDAQLETAMAEGRKRMIAATVEKMKLYGCAGKAPAKR